MHRRIRLLPLLMLGLGAGCALPERAPARADFSGPLDRACTGDWDDLEYAVRAAAARNEMAIRRREITADAAFFELRTIHDERAELRAERRGKSAATAGDELTLRFFIAPFGDEARTRRLLNDLALRLSQLEGVGYAPLPRGW